MLEFGLITFNRGPFSSAGNLATYAQRAEALGYDFLGINDHVIIPRADPGAIGRGDKHWTLTRDYFDVLQTAMYLAGLTRRIRIGTSVLILPYRPPLQTAKALATLDVFSGGRLFVGAGTGWWPEEFEALGLGDHFADRGERTDEHLRIFKTLWSEPTPSFAGKFHRFENIEFSPRPLQQPGPPIWIAGNNPRAQRRMAELGDVWHPAASAQSPELLQPAALAPHRQHVLRLFEQAGRDPATLRIALRAPIRLAETGGKASAPLEGPLEHVLEGLRAFQAQGVTHLAIMPVAESFAGVLDQIARIAEQVIPHFR